MTLYLYSALELDWYNIIDPNGFLSLPGRNMDLLFKVLY